MAAGVIFKDNPPRLAISPDQHKNEPPLMFEISRLTANQLAFELVEYLSRGRLGEPAYWQQEQWNGGKYE